MKLKFAIGIAIIFMAIITSCEPEKLFYPPTTIDETATTSTTTTTIAPASNTLIEVVVTNDEQDFNLPDSYFDEYYDLYLNAQQLISSWQDLLYVGAITEQTYAQKVEQINAQLDLDTIALTESYYNTDNYGMVTLDFKVTNSNSVYVSVYIYFEVTCLDGTTIQDYAIVYNVPSNSYLNSSTLIDTNDKGMSSYRVSGIVIL